jgi:hypothetical protein
MRIILIITVLESLVVASWLLALKYSRLKRFELAALRLNGPMISGTSSIIQLPATNPFSVHHWAFINDWHVEDQADDRKPMSGKVSESSGSPSARRAGARRSHQLSYKEWSKDRSE